jgi:hypothetical protein
MGLTGKELLAQVGEQMGEHGRTRKALGMKHFIQLRVLLLQIG